MALIGSRMLRIKASLSGSTAYPPERNAGTLYLLWLTEVETGQMAALRRPRG
jgi:hypothetical protein